MQVLSQQNMTKVYMCNIGIENFWSPSQGRLKNVNMFYILQWKVINKVVKKIPTSRMYI